MIPLDWCRCAVPFTAAHSAFYRGFSRSLLRASFDCMVLVFFLEALRLVCFYYSHRASLAADLAPEAMADASLAAWPDGLIVTLSRRATGAAELSVNRKLPLEVALPAWISSALNFALSYMMRSSVVLHLVPPKPTMLIADETDVRAGLVHRPAGEGNHVAVLTEKSLYLAAMSDDDDATSAESAEREGGSMHVLTPLLRISILEALAVAFCSPLGGSGGGSSASPLASLAEGSGLLPPRSTSGYACRKRDFARLTAVLADEGGGVGRLVFVLLLIAMHLSATLFAVSEAFLGALLAMAPIMLLVRLGLRRPDEGSPSMTRTLAMVLYAQTSPLVVHAMLEGPLALWWRGTARGDATLDATSRW